MPARSGRGRLAGRCQTAALALGGGFILSTDTAPALGQTPVVIDELVVTAPGRIERPLLETTTSVTLVEGEDLERQQATSFEELIGDVPGVTIEGGPRPIAQEPNIRGFQDGITWEFLQDCTLRAGWLSIDAGGELAVDG